MELGFWKKIKKPFLAMAPMADVTDAAFRRMFVKYSKNETSFSVIPAEAGIQSESINDYVTWTEFVSADGLCLAPEEGRKRLLRAFDYIEAERPIVAQIFGSNPEHIERAVAMVRELGFDGVDINMGCPDRSVEKQKAGAALIKNPELAKEIILSAKRGAKGKDRVIPVSVKTRIGYNKDELEKWLPKILEAEPALVTIHARTRKEMSLVPARWERIKRAVEIRDEVYERLHPTKFLSLHHSDTNNAGQSPMTKILKGKEKTLIAGNGDVSSREDALLKIKESGADGAMVGRGIFGNPWFFSIDKRSDLKNLKRSDLKKDDNYIFVEEKLNALVEHTKLFEELCEYKNFSVMKKHYKAYCHGFDGAKELRIKLMEAESGEEVENLIKNFKIKM
jgi:tRNA-dihydrouridine synthase